MNLQKTICALAIMLFSLVGNKSFSQTFYDINTVQTISITFSQSNWDYMLDTAYAGSGGYIMAQSITINGTTFDSVGVKYKGNSTYNASQVKNPFHIELDTYKDHIYEGYTDMKLSNVAKDPSFLREVLSYSVLRNYMDASLSNFANVTVNGSLIGLYVSSESVSKKFINNHFYSNDSAFFKCNPIDGAGPTTTTLPNLVYQGNDSTNVYYTEAYELKSDYGWADLINLTNTLKNNISNIENVLDVDRALWMLAFNNVTVNLDSYSGGFAQNYYLYKDATGRFNPILWDFNESFGGFSQTGTISLPTTASKQQMTHLLHSGDANWPLIQQLLAVPSYKKMYLAHMHTILTENFTNGSYYATAQAIQPVINASVQADPNKFFTYAQYQSNLTTDVTTGGGPGGATYPGITNLMNGRNTYLSALPDFTNTKPVITAVTPSVPVPVLNSTVFITANVTNTTTSAVKLGYRYALADKFTRVQMFDDGAHGDGAAGDNVYGASLPVSSFLIQYYIYAENANVGAFSPVRAEHEFYSLTATNPVVTGNIVMNEIYARGTTANPDWIEIYNKSNTAVDISGYKIYDAGGESAAKPKKLFPAGSVLSPLGFLVIVTDDTTSSGFGLSASGEKVWLENAASQLIDTITYAAHTALQSYGRIPNGGAWQLLDSITRNASNVAGGSVVIYSCATGTTTGTATAGTVVSGLSFSIPYSNATVASTYATQIKASTGVTGLTATLNSGTYTTAAGNVIFTVTGTPSAAGTATFSITYGSSSCSYAIAVVPPYISNSNIVMNEIYARGTTANPDWIEIYNKSNAAINISGFKIYDSGGDAGTKPKKEFPTGSIVAANGFLVIVVDDTTASGFGLSASGEKVWLENTSAQLIDTITYAAHTALQSYGRIPNGGNWQVLDSITRNASNIAGGAVVIYNCASGTTTGTATAGTAVAGLLFTIPFTNATTGATYPAQAIASTGVTGLTATLSSGTYSAATGNVNFTVSGTPSGAGTASFNIVYGSSNCSYSITVNSAVPTLVYNCSAGTTIGTATANTAVSGLSFSIPYSNATMGTTYAAQTINSTGITGLTATRNSGTYNATSGNIVYTVSGTASGVGASIFSIVYGSSTCNYTIAVDSVVVPINGAISIYPNPVQKTLYFKNLAAQNVSSIAVFDAMGRQVMALQLPNISSGINVETLSKGLYFLKLTETGTLKTSTYKFIKQ